jgi:hypothetical protein
MINGKLTLALASYVIIPRSPRLVELSRKVEKAEGGKGQAASKKAQKGTISGKAEQKGIKRGRKR